MSTDVEKVAPSASLGRTGPAWNHTWVSFTSSCRSAGELSRRTVPWPTPAAVRGDESVRRSRSVLTSVKVVDPRERLRRVSPTQYSTFERPDSDTPPTVRIPSSSTTWTVLDAAGSAPSARTRATSLMNVEPADSTVMVTSALLTIAPASSCKSWKTSALLWPAAGSAGAIL